MDSPRSSVVVWPSPSEYLSSWGTLCLVAIGVALSATFAADIHGDPFLRYLGWVPALLGLLVTAWLSRTGEPERRRLRRRALGAVVVGFGGAVTHLSLWAPLVAAAIAGLATGPEVALIASAHRARRRHGQPFVYPEGLPRWRLVALVAGPIAVLAAVPVLGVVRAELLAGVALGLWAVSAATPEARPEPPARLNMAFAALPALVLGIVLWGLGPILIGLFAVPVLLWRVRRFAVTAVAVTLLLAASLSLATQHVRKFPHPPGFETLGFATLHVPGLGTLRVTATLHRETGAVEVFSRRMVFFNHQNDPRLVEALVHPVMALAPRRKRILAVGAECNGILRELAKYREIERIDVVILHEGIDAFCRSMPTVRRHLGPRPKARIRTFRFDELEELVDTARREGKRYDVALVFGPNPPVSPAGLHSSQLYFLLHGLTTPEGVLAARVGGFKREALAQCALSRIAERFPNLLRYHIHGPGGPRSDEHLYALAVKTQPKGVFRIRVPTRVITESMFQASRRFPKGVTWRRIPEPPGGCATMGSSP